jgi:diamine N-acetyltransferase
MNLTFENCPGHTAFTTMEKLLDVYRKAACFGLFTGSIQVGFIATEKVGDSEMYYLDKLAVLPEQRHKGYGAQLVQCAIGHAAKQGGKVISLGMIDSNTVLKEWYKSLGFKEKGTKKFEHLPFLVCFMDLELSA